MEEKLESFRLRKRRTEKINYFKSTFTKIMSFGTTSTKEIPSHVVDIVEKSEKSEKLVS